MSGLVPFEFEGKQLRATVDGWFVAADVCAHLGISKHRDALARLDDDERGSVEVDTLGGPQRAAAVNEPGLYTLVLSSRKLEARRFKRWVTHEVLPALRKTGRYAVKPAPIGKSAKFQMRTTAERLERLKLAALKTGLKQTTFVERAIDKFFIELQIEEAERERLIQVSKQYLLSRPLP